MIRLLPLSYATRNLGRSVPRLALSVGGAALVALLAMAGAGFALGMDRALRASGHERNVILLGAGSEESVERSEIPRATAGQVSASAPGIGAWDGQPLASPEINVALTVSADAPGDREARASANGLVRGVTPSAFLVHPQVRMTAGRAPESGADEVALRPGLAMADVAAMNCSPLGLHAKSKT